MNIQYCNQCGSNNIEFAIPEGDNRARHVCLDCAHIHYQNPKIVAGCLVQHKDHILFCRRAIEPRHGFWTLPAGFMENQESIAEAAARETWEEAQAKVNLRQLYTVLNLPHINQVYMMYLADLDGDSFAPGTESLEVELRTIENIPWDELAFPTIRETLKLYVEDINKGHFSTHTADIIRHEQAGEAPTAKLVNLQSC